jgi:hypothetical protein
MRTPRKHHTRIRRLAVGLSAGALATVGTTVLTAVPASAAMVTQQLDTGPHTWVVPSGVDSIQLTVYGAQGGGVLGGKGALVSAAFRVVGGQTLAVSVGAQGTSAAGGYGGGGAPGAGKFTGFGGGGASRVTVGGKLLVAAGGGGGQADDYAGGASGSMGTAGASAEDGGPGTQGTSSSAGMNGLAGGLNDVEACSRLGRAGTPGNGRAGGAGGAARSSGGNWTSSGGGGGGGGYYGGGGGGGSAECYNSPSSPRYPNPQGGGGGGGSSYLDGSRLGGSVWQGVRAGDGSVVITYDDVWAPTSTPVVTPALPPSAAGWYDTDVTATWNWTDQGSGIDPARCAPSTTLSPVEGQVGYLDIVSTCADRSGNLSTAHLAVKVDTVPPVSSPTYTAGLVTWHWADAGSGIDPSRCPATSPLVHGLVATCTDLVGNSSTSDFPGPS